MTFHAKNNFDYSSNKGDRKIKCAWIKIFHKNLSKSFYKLGYLVGCNPFYFIIVPILLSLIFATGFQAMVYEKDPEYLFSPSNAIGRDERRLVETLFPVNYSHSFDPSRITKISAFVRLIITSKDNETLFRTHIWDEIMELDSLVQNETIEWRENAYTYGDVCAVWKSKCIENQILDLYDIIPSVENGSRVIDYPLMMFPMIFPFFYGGVEVNETDRYLLSASGIVLHYWLKEDDWKQKERSLLWENQILQMLHEQEFESIEIAPFVSMSLEDELESNTSSIIGYLPPTVLIMVIFSLVSTISCDWVRSKIQISILGIVTAGLGTICSFGLLMYCQIPFIGINLAAPFLLLGIGIDDMFVVLSAWRRTRIQDAVPLRLAETYMEAAVSITITSLTNMLSFFIGAITPFPSVYIFCVYTGVAILLTYIFFISFFGGCLALAGYQEKRQAHAVSFQVVKAKSESETESGCYNACCSGGISREDPWNRQDNQPHALMVFFRDYVSWALNKPCIKALVILAFLGYLAGAIYGCLHIKEGLEKKNLALDYSYLTNYYEKEDTLFRKFPYRIQVIINENITYSDPETKRSVLRLHRSFENLTCVGPSYFTQSWYRGFRRFLKVNPKHRNDITDEASFIRVLRENYLSPGMPEELDVVFNEDFSQIVASRFIIQAFDIKDTNEDKDMMLELRRVAQEAPFEVHPYYPLFVFFDQFVLVAPLTLQTILAVAFLMMLVSLVFIPNPLCCLWVIFSIISIELGVMGYMSLWGVSLDCISMINLIMCIGFSVDFSAHISYSYLTAKADTPAERVRECMFNLGFPVIQSGLSTIAGVFMFIVAPSNIFRTFFKIICLVIFFGSMHAIFLLPVMLSIFGPGSCRSKKTESSLTAAIATIANVETNDKSCAAVCVTKPPLESSETGPSSEYTGSVYSESIQDTPDDSDTDSTQASSRSHDLEEISESCTTVEEDEEHGNTYL